MKYKIIVEIIIILLKKFKVVPIPASAPEVFKKKIPFSIKKITAGIINKILIKIIKKKFKFLRYL